MRSARLARALTAAVAASALTVLAACGADSDAASADGGDGETRMFEADNGTVEIPADPQRIIATGYAVPELIESGAPLVGRSSWERGIPLMSKEERQRYDDIDQVGGEMASELDYEAIAVAEPDLIIIGVPAPVLGDVDMKRLEKLAPTVAIGPTVPSAWRTLTRRQSDAAGVLGSFDERKAAYEEKAARLRKKYAAALDGMEFGHVGAYAEVAKGQFQREYSGSWGTNIAEDIGVDYYGEVAEKTGGSGDVSEYLSIETLPKSFAGADAISYSVDADGSVPEPVQYVLDSPLWKNLPAVEDDHAFAFPDTQAATYESAARTLGALDDALEPLLDEEDGR